MFIKYENIKSEKVIDVRTESEFKSMNLFPYNIPIINETQHNKIKLFYPTALFIIAWSIFRQRELIKESLLNISNDGEHPIIVACSRGRLRSPLTYLYAKYLGLDCKVLTKGIKHHFKQ